MIPTTNLPSILVTALLLTLPPARAGVDFVREVQPILEQNCYKCHGPEKQKGGLRLDVKVAAFKGGDDHGPAIVPGKSAESPVIKFVSSSDPDEKMPPKGDPLTVEQIALLRTWIDAGADWPDSASAKIEDPAKTHWAFQPLRRPEPPGRGNPIDSFIAAKLAEQGLARSPEADQRSLIRRLYLVLTGLPPTPEEVAAFAADPRPQAFEELVDTLLASPRYGEAWARHWLDVIPFGETHGFEVNTPRENAWPYRDYVIEAFNKDTPFPRFILEQLAGDAVGEPRGTGFIVAAAALLPGQIGKDEESKLKARQDELSDMVAGVGGAFLGLTLHCARCHDHKFDPVPQTDYYSLQAVFAGVRHGEHALPTADWEERQKQTPALRERLEAAKQRLLEFGALADKVPADLEGERLAAWHAANGEFKALEKALRDATRPPMVYAGKFEQPAPTCRLNRGDVMQPREEVPPAGLSRIGGSWTLPGTAPEQERRLALARWLGDPQNPLPARVLVNRLWQHHFGEGIVSTPNDFGRNGARPTHPELLDWLAGEFIAGGWSIKHLQKLIVMSATWRQADAPRPDGLAKDAAARLLWRYPAHRLDAEGVRDSILAVAGTLDLRMGGPGFSVFAPNFNYVRVYDPKADFGPPEWRRMIYMTKVRMAQDSTFGAFDCPDAGQASPKRARSTTALQALSLFNSSFVIQQAGLLAERLQREAGDDPAAQVHRGFLLAFQREPADDETQLCAKLARDHGLPTLCRVLLNSNELLFIP